MEKSKQSLQTFLKSYKQAFPTIVECRSKGSESLHYAHCTVCQKDFYIGASGRRDIACHCSGKKHADKEKLRRAQPAANALSNFFPRESAEAIGRLDDFYSSLSADEDVRGACAFLSGLLVVPHSSAACERSFSFVRKIKTDQRSLLGDSTLEALIVSKSRPGCAIEREYSDDELNYFKGSRNLVCYPRCLPQG